MYSDLIGKPFANGGRGPDGYDCLGLALEIFRRTGLDVPDYNIPAFHCARIDTVVAQEAATSWQRLPGPIAPCLVVIKNHPQYINHVGVCVGSGMFIHVMQKVNVCLDRLDSPVWRKKIRGFYRYVG